MAYGYNPCGGYGVPAQPMYAQQMQTMGQMNPQQMPTQPSVIARQVTSREEATTAQIPFDSTINVFVNLSAGEVYIKRFNPNTGGAWFCDYIDAAKAQQMAQDAARPQQEYVTMEQFTQRLSGLEGRVSELTEAMSARRKRGTTADE